MKRLACTVFALFYGLSALGLTAERTQVWLTEHASLGKHGSSSDHGLRAEDVRRPSPPHVRSTLLLEDHSVVLSSFVRSFDPIRSESELHHRFSGFTPEQRSRTISSRAPPTIL
jgi:hypothetical protein